jgi:glucokinase
VVGGGRPNAGDARCGPVPAEIRRRACVAPVDRIAIVRAELGPHAGAVGAALWSAESAISPRAGGEAPGGGGGA